MMEQRYRQFRAIYYCATVLAYTVSLLQFFWELPSLLLRFSLSDLTGLLSYQLGFTLIESAAVAAGAMILVYILPVKQVKEHFSVTGVLFVIFFALGSLIFKWRRTVLSWLFMLPWITPASAGQVFVLVWLFAVLGLPLISIVFLKSEKFVSGVRIFTENLTTLATLYTGMGLLGIIIVIYRNLG